MNQVINLFKIWEQNNYFQSSDFDYFLIEEKQKFLLSNLGNNEIFFETKAKLLIDSINELMLIFDQLKLPNFEHNLTTLWNFWLPRAMDLGKKKSASDKPFIQGILGSQGVGKTTLTTILHLLLKKLGYSTIGFSLDDFYLTHAQRELLKQEDSRFIWRGPPGTHDVELGIKVLNNLLNCQYPVEIPSFDKSLFNGDGDRQNTPILIHKADIILFEGWFVGVMPIEKDIFENNPPNPIITPEDIKFAQEVNEKLKTYLPLWEKLDNLMILYPADYRWSLDWRKEAEHKMIAEGKTGMNDTQIEEFVNYFWKSLHPELFIKPLKKNNLVIEINYDHSIGDILNNYLTG